MIKRIVFIQQELCQYVTTAGPPSPSLSFSSLWTTWFCYRHILRTPDATSSEEVWICQHIAPQPSSSRTQWTDDHCSTSETLAWTVLFTALLDFTDLSEPTNFFFLLLLWASNWRQRHLLCSLHHPELTETRHSTQTNYVYVHLSALTRQLSVSQTDATVTQVSGG